MKIIDNAIEKIISKKENRTRILKELHKLAIVHYHKHATAYVLGEKEKADKNIKIVGDLIELYNLIDEEGDLRENQIKKLKEIAGV